MSVPEEPVVPQVKKRPHIAIRISKAMAWTVLSVLVLIVALLGTGWWYTTTPDFQRRVGREVVKVLEDATGGGVELGKLRFSLRHLAIEADGLIIHGTEGPGEAPYVSLDKIDVRLKISSFLSHTAGVGLASHVGLSLLRVEHPQIHLIIDKDGKTNQPVPKHSSTSKESLTDTLLDLKASQVELLNGVALLNDRAIPFDLAARDLDAEVHYISKSDRYGATVDLRDLRTKMTTYPEAQSKLHVEAELGRDAAKLTKLELTTGKSTVVKANASLDHFAQPEWQAAVDGSLELKQIGILAGFSGLTGGVADLNLRGHNCTVTPAVAQKHLPFWRSRHPKSEQTSSSKTLAPDPDCKAGYLLVGEVKVHKAGYEDQDVRLHDIDGSAHLKITPADLLFTALTGYLPGGGSAEGDLRITNWLGEVPSDATAKSPSTLTATAAAKTANRTAAIINAAPPVTGSLAVTKVQPAHAYLTATAKGIPLRTIMDVVAPKGYGDLGFDTTVSGPVKAEWSGPASALAASVQVDGDLKFAPSGSKRAGAASNIPVSGQAQAHYDGRTEVVRISRIQLLTPQSTLNASGVLGVNIGDPLTALQVNLSVRDLGEYDQLLQTLGLESNGKKGSAAIPLVLHGGLEFQGSASGPIADLDVKGHLQAQQVEVKLGTGETQQADVLVDSVVADAEFSPYSGLAVASSTITRGTAVLNVGGSVKPHKVISRRRNSSYVWDDDTVVNAQVRLTNAQMADVLQIAGQQGKYPVTGTLNLHGNVNGTLGALNGGGNVALANGVAYGEAFQTVSADLTVQGKAIEGKNVLLKAHDMQVTGNGGYDMASQRFHAHLQGDNLLLSKLDTVKKSGVAADGTLTLVADANGTIEQPGLVAKLKLANVTVSDKPLGDATADVHSQGTMMYLTAQASAIGTKIDATGQTQLTGDYQTQAKLNFAGLDLGKAVDMFSTTGLKVTSNIDGTVTVNGPLKTPMKLEGNAALNNFSVKLQGIDLKAAEPIRVSLKNGVATLEQLHITGTDTDLHAGGTAQILGATGAKGGALNLRSTGSVSPALAHVVDREVQASGKVSFNVAAVGQMKEPQLTGKINFEHVNASMESIPNGLTDMNGSMTFNEDRLQVENLTATTGGGKVTIGGFFTYRNEFFADLTLGADTVRVRYNGLSATANASLKLQGGPDSLRLSGNMLITRFGVGANVDFAAFAGSGGVAAPPDPNSIMDKIVLDVHVTSSPQLDFQNSYAKLAGTVDLTVRGTIASPTVLGRIQVTDGSATFAGTTYQLQRGDIYFSNPVRIDPVIDIDATARVESYDITVGLHGTSTNLKPTYRSEPPLSEADVFNLLALGRTQEEAQLYQEKQVQQGTDPTTSALLGGALNATVSNRVSKLFGVGSVKIDPAFVGTLGNSSARITVEQQLTQQLTLTYAQNVNQTAQQLIQVQYQLNRNMSIVATRDETGVFSVVYKIRKRYR
ncbi:translocation/assembly module TamB domain-containing protein [Granulicella aggregans]|uniref:translocation/assembly module TamB domain-containing protein n=1 Tax=Granulicella aggregans TaxID=474949 RepID=UPI0021DF76D0|nr:translocation/assembly module TamB domain-containing protein [Granulicella aggregans]